MSGILLLALCVSACLATKPLAFERREGGGREPRVTCKSSSGLVPPESSVSLFGPDRVRRTRKFTAPCGKWDNSCLSLVASLPNVVARTWADVNLESWKCIYEVYTSSADTKDSLWLAGETIRAFVRQSLACALRSKVKVWQWKRGDDKKLGHKGIFFFPFLRNRITPEYAWNGKIIDLHWFKVP